MIINPVLEKELKTRMRGWKTPLLITSYLLFLGLVVFFGFLSSNIASRYSMNSFSPVTALGVYNILAVFQLLLVIFITPALTAASVSGERERQTLDLLLCTNLTSFSVIAGKVVVAIAQVMLLVAASLPVMGIVFFYGGVRATDLLILFGFYLVTAVMLGSMGAFFSTLFKRSATATIISYITVLALIIGTPVLYGIWSSVYYPVYQKTPQYYHQLLFMFGNPLFGFSSVVEGQDMSYFMGNFISVGYYGGPGSQSGTLMWVQPWMANLIFDVVAAACFVRLAAWRLNPVRRRRRSKSK